MDENKKRALAAALGQIERQFGKGSVMRMGDRTVEAVETIGTGSLMLDIALGIGGLPKGRVVEVYGPESSGKTTLTLQAIAQCQKAGGTCAFIDAEHALDPIYAQKLGVNLDELYLSQPDTGEQALEIADMLVRSNAVDMVVVDSVAALTPKAEIEGEMGVNAKLVDKAGAWYSYDGERIGQGKENARQYLKENPAAAQKLEAALREKFVPEEMPRGEADGADDDA